MSGQQHQSVITKKKSKCRGNRPLQRFKRRCRAKGLNDDTIGKLKCNIVAGAANNQLKDEQKHGMALIERGILYAPDYLINAGGLINCYSELEGYNRERAMQKTEIIYPRALEIFEIAAKEKITTQAAANRIAEERIRLVAHINSRL